LEKYAAASSNDNDDVNGPTYAVLGAAAVFTGLAVYAVLRFAKWQMQREASQQAADKPRPRLFPCASPAAPAVQPWWGRGARMVKTKKSETAATLVFVRGGVLFGQTSVRQTLR
jgi:hypothetical protein